MKNKIIFAQVFFAAVLSAVLCIFASPAAAQEIEKQKIQPPVPEGYSVIDGDMIMPTRFIKAVLRGDAQNATFDTSLWTGGIVRFQFQNTNMLPSNCPNAVLSGAVSAANQTNMINAMAVLENVANVDFQQCPNNNCGNTGNWIFIRDSTGDIIRDSNNNCVNGEANNSQIGMVGGQQSLNIVTWGTPFIIVHELLHALGFYHEHQRADRDTYVAIYCFNVQGGCQGTIFNTNFPIFSNAKFYGAYDFDSLMHYDQCAFASNMSCPAGFSQTIGVREPYTAQWQNAIGQRTHLSVLDQATVSFLYRQPNWRFIDCNYNGSNGASDGTIFRPYTTLATALANTPAGGTLWVSGPCPPFPVGTYSNNVTIRVAPNITARFGG